MLTPGESPMVILLVEDEESDVLLIRRALTKGGVTNPIVDIRDGQQASDFLCADDDTRGEPLPGLVLLDINLPKVDGLQILRNFKATPGGKRTPVIVLTSSNDSTDINKAYDAGANSYLVKPVTFSAFTEVAIAIKAFWVLQNNLPSR